MFNGKEMLNVYVYCRICMPLATGELTHEYIFEIVTKYF